MTKTIQYQCSSREEKGVLVEFLYSIGARNKYDMDEEGMWLHLYPDRDLFNNRKEMTTRDLFTCTTLLTLEEFISQATKMSNDWRLLKNGS